MLKVDHESHTVLIGIAFDSRRRVIVTLILSPIICMASYFNTLSSMPWPPMTLQAANVEQCYMMMYRHTTIHSAMTWNTI